MASFGENSEKNLSTVHADVQKVLRLAIQITDFSVICGLRSEQQQAKEVAEGSSWIDFPGSKHNRSKKNDGTWDYELSDAVDVVPYPVKWPDVYTQTSKEYMKRMGRFYFMAGVILACSFVLGIKLFWGGWWKKFDSPHFHRVVN